MERVAANTKRTFALLASASLALVHGANAFSFAHALGTSGNSCDDLAFSVQDGAVQDQSGGMRDVSDPLNSGFFAGAANADGVTSPNSFDDCVTARGMHLYAPARGSDDSTNLAVARAPQNWYDPGLQNLVSGTFSDMDFINAVAGKTYGTTIPCPYGGATAGFASGAVTDCAPDCATTTTDSNAVASGGTCRCAAGYYGRPMDINEDSVLAVTNGCTACPTGASFATAAAADCTAVTTPTSKRRLTWAMPFTEELELVHSDRAAHDSFGDSVSISGDYAIVGVTRDDDNVHNSGSAVVFVRSEGTWLEQQKLTATNPAYHDHFGVSVSISGDYAVVGAPWRRVGGTFGVGIAFVFVRSGATWMLQQELTASDTTGYFGESVSISGDYLIVGAWVTEEQRGTAHVFSRSGTTWTEQQKLTASNRAPWSHFGESVSISGDYAVVGAPLADSRGSAYVFSRSGTTWTEEQKIRPTSNAVGDYFGGSVSISGDCVVVGASRFDGSGDNSGFAYVFRRSGTTWVEEQKLVASQGSASDNFGASVSISGDYIVVGASQDDDNGSRSGSAYVFGRSGTTWVQQKLRASDGAADDYFGNSVAVSGDRAVVGAFARTKDYEAEGAVYLFTLPPIESVPDDESPDDENPSSVNPSYVRATLDIAGYTAVEFTGSIETAFRTGVAAVLNVDVNSVSITSVIDVQTGRRRLLQTSNVVRVNFRVYSSADSSSAIVLRLRDVTTSGALLTSLQTAGLTRASGVSLQSDGVVAERASPSRGIALSTGAIAGVVVGGFAFIVTIIVVACRRNAKRQNARVRLILNHQHLRGGLPQGAHVARGVSTHPPCVVTVTKPTSTSALMNADATRRANSIARVDARKDAMERQKRRIERQSQR